MNLLELAVMNLRNLRANSMILTVEEIQELTSCVSETCVNIEMVVFNFNNQKSSQHTVIICETDILKLLSNAFVTLRSV